MAERLPQGMSGFFERIGGMLVHPRRTLREILGGTVGGLSDVALLLALRLVAGETRVGGHGGDSSVMLARGLLWLGKSEPMLAAQGVLQATARLLPDLLAIVVGSVALAVLAGRRTGGRELDLAAMAWVPALLVKTAGALAFSLLGRDPSEGTARSLELLALGWAATCWVIALWTLRADRAEPVDPDRPVAG